VQYRVQVSRLMQAEDDVYAGRRARVAGCSGLACLRPTAWLA
jgi:hypothetical protein